MGVNHSENIRDKGYSSSVDGDSHKVWVSPESLNGLRKAGKHARQRGDDIVRVWHTPTPAPAIADASHAMNPMTMALLLQVYQTSHPMNLWMERAYMVALSIPGLKFHRDSNR